MGRKVSQKDGTKRLDSFALHAPEHTFAQRLAAVSPLSLYFPRSCTLNAHSTHMPIWSKVAYATRDIRARFASITMLDTTSFKSMIMPVACECSSSVSGEMAFISSMSMLSASAIAAFAGAACNSRATLGESDTSCAVPIRVIRASYMPHMLAFGNRILCYF